MVISCYSFATQLRDAGQVMVAFEKGFSIASPCDPLIDFWLFGLRCWKRVIRAVSEVAGSQTS